MKAKKSQELQGISWRPRAVGVSSSLNPKAWEPEEPMVQILAWLWVQSQEETDIPAWRQAESMNSPIVSLLFFSGLQRLDEAHPHQGGQSALLSPLIQMLLSSRNTLADTPRIMFNQMSGHPMAHAS